MVCPEVKWQQYYVILCFDTQGAEKVPRTNRSLGEHENRRCSSSHLVWRVINRQWQGCVEWISLPVSLAWRNIKLSIYAKLYYTVGQVDRKLLFGVILILTVLMIKWSHFFSTIWAVHFLSTDNLKPIWDYVAIAFGVSIWGLSISLSSSKISIKLVLEDWSRIFQAVFIKILRTRKGTRQQILFINIFCYAPSVTFHFAVVLR